MRSSLVVLALLATAGADGAEGPPEALLARGIELYRAGDLDRALPLLRQAMKRRPQLTGAAHYLGLAQIRLGHTRQGRRTLARAARRDPHNPRLLLDLGLAYLEEGNAAWASQTLRAALDLAPLDGRIRYYLGVALVRLGHPDEALEQLEAARHEPGVDWRRLRLQQGMALYQAGRWRRAREVVGPLLGRTHGLRANALQRASLEAEGTRAAWVDAQLSVGGVVDTNPLYEHERTAPTAVGPGVAGALTLRPFVGTRSMIWGEIGGSRVFYFPTGEQQGEGNMAQDASRTDLRGAAVFSRRFPRGTGRLDLFGGYGFAVVLLDGDPPLADANHIFLEQHGGHVAVQHTGADGATLRLRYALTRDTYAEQPRSNWGNELELEHSRNFLSGKMRLLSWLSLRHELAFLADYDAVVPGGGAGLSYLGPWDLMFGVRLGYEHENHYRSGRELGRWQVQQEGSGRVVSKQRLDNTLSGMAEVGRSLGLGLRLRLAFQWLRNFSTVAAFDYGRHLLTLDLTWST